MSYPASIAYSSLFVATSYRLLVLATSIATTSFTRPTLLILKEGQLYSVILLLFLHHSQGSHHTSMLPASWSWRWISEGAFFSWRFSRVSLPQFASSFDFYSWRTVTNVSPLYANVLSGGDAIVICEAREARHTAIIS